MITSLTRSVQVGYVVTMMISYFSMFTLSNRIVFKMMLINFCYYIIVKAIIHVTLDKDLLQKYLIEKSHYNQIKCPCDKEICCNFLRKPLIHGKFSYTSTCI